jgi:hypothetical protein
MTQDTKDIMAKVYKEGLNIYALKNKFQKEMTYPMPDHILTMVCEEYLKNKPKVHSPWAWFTKVLILKRDEAYVTMNKEKEKEYNKTNPTLLKHLFGGR